MTYNYEIRIEGGPKNQGSIEFSRLAQLAEGIYEIAKGALQIRLEGVSKKRGESPRYLQDAVQIRLKGLRAGSTVLMIESDTIGEHLPQLQGDLFHPDTLKALPAQTPMQLVVASFEEALRTEPQEVSHLDKPLLRQMQALKKFFEQEKEVLSIANEGGFETLQLKAVDFARIRELEEITPDPRPMLISGQVDMLKYSKSLVTILTPEGVIRARVDERLPAEQIGRHWGKTGTFAGTAHFRPDGKLSIFEIQQVVEVPENAAIYLSQVPELTTVEEQMDRFMKKNNGRTNRLKDLLGQWPGDESYDEIIAEIQ